jgi:hypothetical protein
MKCGLNYFNEDICPKKVVLWLAEHMMVYPGQKKFVVSYVLHMYGTKTQSAACSC